jgi:transposase-like protein
VKWRLRGKLIGEANGVSTKQVQTSKVFAINGSNGFCFKHFCCLLLCVKYKIKWRMNPTRQNSYVTAETPIVCLNELAAVEFFETQRWGDIPVCAHCGSSAVYRMMNATGDKRNARFLWRCRACARQYTVRIGTVYEDTRLDLRHWCYAFWRAANSGNGVAALEIMRHCQISYKSALFMMNRIRFAIAPEHDIRELTGADGSDQERLFGDLRSASERPISAGTERGGRSRSRNAA